MLLMLLGQKGGRRVFVSGRDVLLPPSDDEIFDALHRAKRERRIDPDAYTLIASLTASKVEHRATAEDLRSCPFLAEALEELEQVANASEKY